MVAKGHTAQKKKLDTRRFLLRRLPACSIRSSSCKKLHLKPRFKTVISSSFELPIQVEEPTRQNSLSLLDDLCCDADYDFELWDSFWMSDEGFFTAQEELKSEDFTSSDGLSGESNDRDSDSGGSVEQLFAAGDFMEDLSDEKEEEEADVLPTFVPFRILPSMVKQKRAPILESFDLLGIAKYIKEKPVSKILVLTGAGISVAAGIPDFRTPGTGLYSQLERYNLPRPSDIFDLEYFPEHPEPFYMLAKELWPGNYAPTLVHLFINLLHEKGLLLRSYTQNIDGLELVAGIPQEALVEVHGTFASARCLSCCQPHCSRTVKDAVFADRIPQCHCGGLIKPDIVFFGEQLPERFFRMVHQDFAEADLVIVIGTSLQVAPFSSLPDKCDAAVPRLLMNNEVVGEASPCHPAGFEFGEHNYRDAKLIGDCQKGVLELAELLGWKRELVTRHAQLQGCSPAHRFLEPMVLACQSQVPPVPQCRDGEGLERYC